MKLLATASLKLLASAKPLALCQPKALGEASVTALYDVRRLQPSNHTRGNQKPRQHLSKST
ncbi:hypothetical protein DPMN_114975 [Dreissena polymorpha]|uniref:Uncharacterized protein n=1 Tax=Dreissena polymorpha TaxID=45954 RepID=A0A9D4KL18_DREPO|nr:hypothetical protein DPMN_114975 [Dreissena polymorpha]